MLEEDEEKEREIDKRGGRKKDRRRR